MDKGQNLIKKLRKNVIVKDEETNKPGEASNQENENIELVQRVNVEESKVLQSEVKEADPVEEVSPAEPNQVVMEEVKEQNQSPITVLSEEDKKYLSDEARVLVTNEAKVCVK